jgi:hypothetical protein
MVSLGRVMDQAVNRRNFLRGSGFAPCSVHVQYVMGQVSLRVVLISPVNIIPPRLSILICHQEDEQ